MSTEYECNVLKVRL